MIRQLWFNPASVLFPAAWGESGEALATTRDQVGAQPARRLSAIIRKHTALLASRLCKRGWLALGCFALGAIGAVPVQADTSIAFKKDEPVLLEAREMGYDRINAVVVALGNVEVVQGDYIVRADRITYNQNTNFVRASGNVTVLQPDGNVYFGNDVELKDDLKAGVVQNFRVRLKDNSMFAAREAKRVNENVTELQKAVYSPCKLCEAKDGSAKPPLWQIKAEHVKIDEEQKRVKYNNAYFEVYGVPVAYTPYFEHATPDAPNESGLLVPQYGRSSNLGTNVELPVYLSFAPNMDMTLTPMITSKEGEVLSGEFRHLLENGYYEFKGSGTYPGKRDANGNKVAGKDEFRGHIEANGKLAITDDIAWGFNAKRATDDTYLRRYRFGDEDLLTSRLYVEGLRDRNYAVVQGIAFQGLRVGDDPDTSPQIIPMLDASLQTDPMWMGGRASLDTNAMVLTRREGTETRRVALRGAYNLPIVTQGGQVLDLEASVRGEGINVQNNTFKTTVGTVSDDGNQSRVIPEASATLRYPLIKRFEGGQSMTVEPIIQAAVSPSRDPKRKIPNEDSLVREFSDTNLFSTNRFTGWDDLETGPRVTYGLRSQVELDPRKRVQMMLGQTYQTNDNNSFPLANDPNPDLSDVVGKLGLNYNWLDVSYRFKMDQDDGTFNRNEVNALVVTEPAVFGINYAHANDERFTQDFNDISAFSTVSLTDNWSVSGAGQRNLKDAGGMINSSAALTYSNECVTITTRLAKEFTRDRDIEPNTSFTVRLGLKNIE